MMKIIRLAKDVFSLCSPQEMLRIYGLLVMMVIGAGFEVIGIGIIVPFIGLLSDPGMVHENEVLSSAYVWFGIESDNEFLFMVGLTLLVVYIFKNIFAALLVYTQSRFIFGKEARLARDLLSIYMHRPYSFHLQRDVSDLLRNIMTEAANAINGVMLPLLAAITEGMVLLFILLLLFAVDTGIAVSSFLIISIVAYAILSLQGKALTKYGNQRKHHVSQMIKWVTQGFGGIKESKVRGKEKFFVGSFYTNSLGFVRSAQRYAVLNVTPRLVMETVAVGTMLVAVLLVLSRGDNTHEALAILTLFAVASVRLMPSINRMAISFNSMRFYLPALDIVRDEFSHDEYSTLADYKNVGDIGFKEGIKLKGISYRYPDNDKDVLVNISLVINKGETIAFVGSSGAGKSTLVDLILGLHVPTSGQICIDGVDLRTVTQAWQRNIGYVPQSIFLLDGSIRQNVAFAIQDSDIDDDKVVDVLRQARLGNKLSQLPQGLDTQVGENGVRLSGGERQRIGIARALYHNPDLLIFDEATSALDTETEREISQTIRSLMRDKTILIIAHRLSTIKSCDMIYVLKDGGIVETGRYEDLINANGMFSTMIGKDVK